jgi:hypothetical protein
MNLKKACKTAMILAIISFVLVLAGQICNIFTFFIQVSGTETGWSQMPDVPHYSILLTHVISMLPIILIRGLLLAGFITLLSVCLKQQNDPQACVKTRTIVATVLVGLAGLFVLTGSINFISTMFRHHLALHMQATIALSWYLSSLLCTLSLFIFIITNACNTVSQIPAIATIICHLLRAVVMMLSLGNTIYQGLALRNNQYFGNIFSVSWFASSLFSYTGIFLWLTAILLFLSAWLRDNRQPPEAGVVELSPEPLPALSAEEFLPG